MTLQQEGLVMGAPQKCRRIRAMTAKEIEGSYFLSGTLEGVCIVLALPQITKADFVEFDKILAEMKRQSRDVQLIEYTLREHYQESGRRLAKQAVDASN